MTRSLRILACLLRQLPHQRPPAPELPISATKRSSAGGPECFQGSGDCVGDDHIPANVYVLPIFGSRVVRASSNSKGELPPRNREPARHRYGNESAAMDKECKGSTGLGMKEAPTARPARQPGSQDTEVSQSFIHTCSLCHCQAGARGGTRTPKGCPAGS